MDSRPAHMNVYKSVCAVCVPWTLRPPAVGERTARVNAADLTMLMLSCVGSGQSSELCLFVREPGDNYNMPRINHVDLFHVCSC